MILYRIKVIIYLYRIRTRYIYIYPTLSKRYNIQLSEYYSDLRNHSIWKLNCPFYFNQIVDQVLYLLMIYHNTADLSRN